MCVVKNFFIVQSQEICLKDVGRNYQIQSGKKFTIVMGFENNKQVVISKKS